MMIDWFTVAAQTLNFLVLVWLLKRFLYKPILDAIDAREQRIATELANAAATMAEAGEARARFEHMNAEFDRQRDDMTASAVEEAKAERRRLLGRAREDAETERIKWQQALSNERRDLNDALSRCAREEVFAIARKVLTDLGSTSLEEALADAFIRRLSAIDGNAKAELSTALETGDGTARLRSAFALPEAQRAAIQNAFNQTFGTVTPLRFETAPDLVGGIELTTNGQKLAWSIGEYLVALERHVDALLKAQAQPEAGAAPRADLESDSDAQAVPATGLQHDAAR